MFGWLLLVLGISEGGGEGGVKLRWVLGWGEGGGMCLGSERERDGECVSGMVRVYI